MEEHEKLPATNARPPRWIAPGICIFLAAMVWMVFGQTLRHDFVNHDDGANVYDNPAVIKGLTLHGAGWAFTHIQVGDWIPLTTLSHMLDCQLYGLRPRGHHLTNVLLHGAAAILLFLVLRQTTGALWRSAFVAAVFAIHPLRAESVAWVSERKDVLSGVFFMLAIGAYARYTRKQGPLSSYLAALFLFALGLMSKPMLVTLPFVLLLLDFWPLGRFPQPPGSGRGRAPVFFRLILEKAPFFALSAAVCVIQIFVSTEGIVSIKTLSLSTRIANALVSCAGYMGEMIYPAKLAAFYPYPGSHLPAWEVMLALALLIVISAGTIVLRRKHPYFLTGWLWYLVMLAPVIGLLQAGTQAHADRYTYLPQIGLYIAVSWIAGGLCARMPHRRAILGAVAPLTIAALMWRAGIQTSYWRDSKTLWTHSLECTPDNSFARANLGNALAKQGRTQEAIAQYGAALQINPDDALTHNNLANILLQKGQADEAIAHYLKAVEIKPEYAEAHYNLGLALEQKGQTDQAIEQYQKALELKPDYSEAYNNLGIAFQQKGEADKAVASYLRALQIDPDYADAHNNLGYVYQQTGRVDDAIAEYKKTLDINPGLLEAQLNLGAAFGQKGETDEALAQFEKAVEINPGSAKAQNDLGLALLQSGKVQESIGHFQKALKIEPGNAEARYNLGLALKQRDQ